MCTEKFEFLDLVDFGGVAFSVETVEQALLKFPSTGNAVDFGQVPHIVARLAIGTLSCLCEKPLRGKKKL